MLDGHAVPHTRIVVDQFNDKRLQSKESQTVFFLSHFHADHYGKLNKDWNAGKIYCSITTAKLVEKVLGIDRSHLCPLSKDEWHDFPPNCRVALLDANHCPGAVMFLFHVTGTPFLFVRPLVATLLLCASACVCVCFCVCASVCVCVCFCVCVWSAKLPVCCFLFLFLFLLLLLFLFLFVFFLFFARLFWGKTTMGSGTATCTLEIAGSRLHGRPTHS